MKKTILIAATCAASISAHALPTYEPFTEYSSAITATGTNSVNLATGGLSVTTGSVSERWSSLNFSAQGNSPMNSKAPTAAGWDIQVTNFSGSVFTATALSTLLPSGFPGAAGTQVCAFIPYNTINTNNSIGNSAVLNFSHALTRPATGVNTMFVSYLLDISAAGTGGAGNNGRYCAFLQSSNLVEGAGTAGYYPTWQSLFGTFSTTSGPKYISYGVKTGFTGGGDWILASDSASGNYPSLEVAGIGTAYNKAAFVVSAFLLTPGGAIKDTNLLWVNPSTSTFGGPNSTAIQAAPYSYTMTNIAVTDVGGFCLESRIGGGAAGGIGNSYMANLIVGSTWSYVTGGPEFTTQPASAIVAVGANVTLTGAAQAAGQSVAYQWQKIVSGSPVNVSNGSGGAGGTATVSGATNGSLTLTSASPGDAGTFQLLATANGTTYTLTSTNAILTIADPEVTAQPVSETVNYGAAATFTASILTVNPGLTYAWYDGATVLLNGAQPDGSTATGAQGATSSGTLTSTLTLANVSYLDAGNYTLVATNSMGGTVTSAAATLTVNDPYIAAEPPATLEIAQGGTGTISISAYGSNPAFQWYNTSSGQLANGGDDNGVTTSTLTISGAQTSDAGVYYVTVTGPTNTLTSSNVTVYIDTALSTATVTPPVLTQQSGTHLAILGYINGGTGLADFVWQKNGVTLANGTLPDGSYVSGAGASQPAGSAASALILSNMTVGDSGTYTLVASNAAGVVSASGSCIVTVTGKYLALSPTNLIVTRVGEGSQMLSGATGNTLYLDQYTTAGTYVSSIMVPDRGPNAIIVAGEAITTGDEGAQEAYLTLSSNQQYLNFGGFCFSYPFAGADVTVGQQEAGGNTSDIRGIYALNASGVMALVYTNYGLYSGGHGFRDVFSTDGLTNFWTTGSAGGGTVKYVNAGPAGAAYTVTSPGSGIPALSIAATGGVCLGLSGTNLVFSDNETDGDTTIPGVQGLNVFTNANAPEVSNTNSTEILPGGVGHADDFAFSPDNMTLYLADDDVSVSAGGKGGIQRWDNVGGVWTIAYRISDTASPNQTNGFRGLTVYWPTNITTWGQGVEGAVLYATTSETSSNRIVQMIDNGAGSTSTTIVTVGANQFFRGIRFGPIAPPLAIATEPQSQSVIVDQPVTLSAQVTGSMSYYFPNAAGAYQYINATPIYYQWFANGIAIPGANSNAYSIISVQTSNAASYTLVVSNGLVALTSAPPAVLTVSDFTPSSDLVGWFKFNDGSGTNAADSSVYGDTGSLTNFPGDNSEWVAGLGGFGALNYANVDGNYDNGVIVPDAPQLNFTNDQTMSVAAWINPMTNTQILGASIVTKGYGNGGEEYDFDIYANVLRFFVRNAAGGVTSITSPSPLATNTWQHVAATYNGPAGTMGLYINGQLVASATTAPATLLYSTHSLTIGVRSASVAETNFYPFCGDMQDVRIYSYPLTAANVSTVYQILEPMVTGPSHIVTTPPGSFATNGQFQFNMTGSANTAFRLWSTTNAALTPVTSTWTLLSSGLFNDVGNASFTDVAATNSAEYYVITQP